MNATDGFTQVAVKGRLDTIGVRAVDLKLTSHTVTRRKPAIIDLTEVELITSLGIGMLVAISKAMRGHGLDVAIVASSVVGDILRMTNVGSLMHIVRTADDALRALGFSHPE